MFKLLYPCEYVKSAFDIDFEKLYEKGFRGVVFDIDNTLVPHGEDSTEAVEELFQRIHGYGMKTLLLSNNDEERVKRFIRNIDTYYICDADKPNRDGYIKAVEMLGMNKEKIICIGDQLFTDILGANRCEIASILVKYICMDKNAPVGKKRKIESVILKIYRRNRKYCHRLGDISLKRSMKKQSKRTRKNFCDINPVCYEISKEKEIAKRHVKNFFTKINYANIYSEKKLPNLVSEYSSVLIKTGKGIDPVLQENKVVNIKLANKRINGIIIRPGEEFSFWKTVGKLTRRKGYKDGRVIASNKLVQGLGGGICNLANSIHNLILNSDLDVTEFHNHSDALAPDHGKRIPFSSGTSVSYNYIDYRFKNNTNQNYQLILWCADGKSYAQLYSEHSLKESFNIVEENHHFHKENGKYYRVSKIYRVVTDSETGREIRKELILDNHSEVMYSYDQIPKELIR